MKFMELFETKSEVLYFFTDSAIHPGLNTDHSRN